MDGTRKPALAGFILGTILISRHIPTTFALDKPALTSSVTLACAGAAIIASSRRLPRDGERRKLDHHHSHDGDHELQRLQIAAESAKSPEDVKYPSSLRKLRILWVTLVGLLCLRAEILRKVMANVQCSQVGTALLIPLAFAAWEWWTTHRKRKRLPYEDIDHSIYDAISEHVLQSPHVSLCVTALVSIGSLLAVQNTSNPASTYICAASLGHHLAIPWMQQLGTALDIAILHFATSLITQQEGHGPSSAAHRFASLGWAFLSATFVLFLSSIASGVFDPHSRGWDFQIPNSYIWSLVKLDFYIAGTLICGVLSVFHFGVVKTSLLATFASGMTVATASAWSNLHVFPPKSESLAYLGTILAISGVLVFAHVDAFSANDTRNSVPNRTLFTRIPSSFYIALFCLFILWTGLWVSGRDVVNYHPVDMLLYEAQQRHETYLNRTSSTGVLRDAVREYRQRYHMAPPPNFDLWYQYATNRSSVVINEFDTIYDDVLAFRALSPEQVRTRTLEILSDPVNEATGISIRNGTVHALWDLDGPTPRMVDGLLQMVQEFSAWLPDMDLAFSTNNECKVAVPFRSMKSMKKKAKAFDIPKRPVNVFSTNRAQQWLAPPEGLTARTVFNSRPSGQMFHDFGSIGCPSSSKAQSKRHWDLSKVCTSCTNPHSLGAFLANWSTAADVCHQPDLARLHGFYTTPHDFKGTHELYPVFSRSKAPGFNDILYPSVENYLDSRYGYDPTGDHPDGPFEEKESTLFWRGSTSEGFSTGRGEWRGMSRQRLAHVAHNINNSAPAQPVLFPEPTKSKRSRLKYANVPVSKLSELLSTDVHFVDEIVDCNGDDCLHQATEFSPLARPINFQAHWNYKYLLDLDGEGSSDRFIPFLRSRSLPFKASLFREWWDTRITPWVHFVPLDLRGHGLWATLAYFQGIDGKVNGKDVKIEARQGDAERIATQGRRWAENVLRKEDMEIYLFRLLLEWGRMTDDRRDELGFVGDG